jgi:hypothetical protein
MFGAPTDAAEAVRRFLQAWNTQDAPERLALLQSCCAADAEFISTEGIIRGLEPFNAGIGGFLRAFPRAEVLHGTPDAHNGYVRVRWRTRFNDGATDPLFGDDFVQFDAEMRIIRVVSFDGSPADA